MKRRGRFGHNAEALPLFPVLAVLLSTVGVLCLLLLVVTREALFNDSRRQRVREARQAIAQVRAAIEKEEKRQEQLTREIHRVQKRIAEIEGELHDLTERTLVARERTAAAQTRLQDVTKRIERLRSRLATAREIQRSTEPTDAPGWVVTLAASPHGDQRTPLFLECRSDRVSLQPGGIDLFEADFATGPAGRSVFQFFAASVVRTLEERGVARPYPVLMVRPDGIPAFYAAMHQLEAAGLPFGYELVESEQRLHYPPLESASEDELRNLLAAARIQAQQPPVDRPPLFPNGVTGMPAGGTGAKSKAPLGPSIGGREDVAGGPRRGEATRSIPAPATTLLTTNAAPAGAPPPSNNRIPGVAAKAPKPLVLAPPHGGVWYRPVHALLTEQSLSVLPRAGYYPPAPGSDEQLNKLLQRLVALTAVQSRLVVLAVRPRVVCMFTPDAVLDYWRLKWHLARAGVALEPVLITNADAVAVDQSLAFLRPLGPDATWASKLDARAKYHQGGLR